MPNWRMTYLLDQIVPALREAGMSGEQIDQTMVEAPRRWLTGGAA